MIDGLRLMLKNHTPSKVRLTRLLLLVVVDDRRMPDRTNANGVCAGPQAIDDEAAVGPSEGSSGKGRIRVCANGNGCIRNGLARRTDHLSSNLTGRCRFRPSSRWSLRFDNTDRDLKQRDNREQTANEHGTSTGRVPLLSIRGS